MTISNRTRSIDIVFYAGELSGGMDYAQKRYCETKDEKYKDEFKQYKSEVNSLFAATKLEASKRGDESLNPAIAILEAENKRSI